MYKKIVFIGMITLLFVGCKKPQTVSDLSTQSSSVFPTTLDQLNGVLADGYANERNFNLNGWQLLVVSATSAHDADQKGPMDQIDQSGDYSPYNSPATNSKWTTSIWTGFYDGVRDANSTLNAAAFYLKNNPSDSVAVKAIVGQALVLRAYYYIQLECFYGQKYIDIKQPATSDANILGVPLYTEVPASLAETQEPRATARAVWNFITNDLKTAAPLLPSSWTGVDIGRVTSYTAKGLLGKAYVYTQNWDSAKTVLLDVITNSGKTLMPYSQYVQAFNSNAFPGSLNNNQDQKFNEESLFEIEVERVSVGAYGVFSGAPNASLTTNMGLNWSPSCFDDYQVSQSMGRATCYVHDKNLLRFGFRIPLDSITVASMVANQAYDPNSVAHGYLSTSLVPGTWYTHESDSLRNQKGADPRLYVCALEPYMDTVVCAPTDGTGNSGLPSDRIRRPVSKSQNLPNYDNYFGWSFKKYQTLDANLNEPGMNQCDGANYYLLRLADIYLLYAEACMNTSDNSGLLYLNMVHSRAYNGYLGSTEHDYASYTSPTKADPSDVNLTNNPIAFERHAELFAEGHWWFDVGRWGNSTNSSATTFNGTPGSMYNINFGVNEANYYGNLLPDNHPSEWDNTNGKSYCWPIPTVEINANSKLSAQVNNGQNLGY
jgi:hypothetical protein